MDVQISMYSQAKCAPFALPPAPLLSPVSFPLFYLLLFVPPTFTPCLPGRTLPAVQAVQGLLKRRADGGCASEVLEVLDTVRREHGPEGVGLTYVYQLAMEACALESRWRDALVLFDEVG